MTRRLSFDHTPKTLATRQSGTAEVALLRSRRTGRAAVAVDDEAPASISSSSPSPGTTRSTCSSTPTPTSPPGPCRSRFDRNQVPCNLRCESAVFSPKVEIGMGDYEGSEGIEVECLSCGSCRIVSSLTLNALGDCPACGYVGWAAAATLSRRDRAELHLAFARPPGTRKQASGPSGRWVVEDSGLRARSVRPRPA